MSADRWKKCPVCAVNKEKDVLKLRSQVNHEYGKLSQEHWLELKKEVDEFASTPLEETLREDFEIGLNEDGWLDIYYTCSCHICGTTRKYEKKEILI